MHDYKRPKVFWVEPQNKYAQVQKCSLYLYFHVYSGDPFINAGRFNSSYHHFGGGFFKESPRGESALGVPHQAAGAVFTTSATIHPEKGINRHKVWTHSARLLFQQVSLARPHTPDNLHARLRGHASNVADITVSRSALTGARHALLSSKTTATTIRVRSAAAVDARSVFARPRRGTDHRESAAGPRSPTRAF